MCVRHCLLILGEVFIVSAYKQINVGSGLSILADRSVMSDKMVWWEKENTFYGNTLKKSLWTGKWVDVRPVREFRFHSMLMFGEKRQRDAYDAHIVRVGRTYRFHPETSFPRTWTWKGHDAIAQGLSPDDMRQCVEEFNTLVKISPHLSTLSAEDRLVGGLRGLFKGVASTVDINFPLLHIDRKFGLSMK
jgi:hypothetical protein